MPRPRPLTRCPGHPSSTCSDQGDSCHWAAGAQVSPRPSDNMLLFEIVSLSSLASPGRPVRRPGWQRGGALSSCRSSCKRTWTEPLGVVPGLTPSEEKGCLRRSESELTGQS